MPQFDRVDHFPVGQGPFGELFLGHKTPQE